MHRLLFYVLVFPGTVKGPVAYWFCMFVLLHSFAKNIATDRGEEKHCCVTWEAFLQPPNPSFKHKLKMVWENVKFFFIIFWMILF